MVTMDNVYTKLKVPQCFQCKRDVEFYCRTCKQDLCILCKERHDIDLDTKDHDVVIYRLKFGDFIIQRSCDKHQDRYLNTWCLLCDLPTCAICNEHRNHEIRDIVSVYKMYREQYKNRIVQIRAEIIPNNQAILRRIKCDVKSCHSKLSKLKQSIAIKSSNLKELAYLVLNDIGALKLSLKSRFQEPKRSIANTEFFMYKLEQLLHKPVKFLLYLRKTTIPKVKVIPNIFDFYLNHELEDATELLDFKITETKKRQVRHEELLELMRTPVLKKFSSVTGFHGIRHISCVKTDIVYFSDRKGQLFLANFCSPFSTLIRKADDTKGHTVTSEGNMIYIDMNRDINEGFTDNTQKTLIKHTEPWIAKCVYSSPINADILVGIIRYFYELGKDIISNEAKILRYNGTGQEIPVIELDNTGKKLYEFPKYITENHNGDVIVSDLKKGVVVTDRTGKHRFSYTGPPSGSGLSPLGICVDALSNILVCDGESDTIQMIDKDGHFLSLLLTKQNGIKAPRALGYDNRNHLLWVGATDKNTEYIVVYRHIQRKGYLTDAYRSQ